MKPISTFFTIVFMDDLVERNAIYYKQFSDVPYTGKVTGLKQGSFKDGQREGYWSNYYENGQLKLKGKYKNGVAEGEWVYYYDNGQLSSKGDYKNDKFNGAWVVYNFNGTVDKALTGTFKDGKKISD